MFKYISSFIALILFVMPSLANTLAAGTEIKTRLEEPVNTQLRKLGFQFRIRVEGDLLINNKVAIKDGTKGLARITKIKSASKTAPAEVEVMLDSLTINRKKQAAPSYPVGGKGELRYTEELGSKNLDQDEMKSSTGQNISNSIPVINKGSYLQINKDTIIYFITAETINY